MPQSRPGPTEACLHLDPDFGGGRIGPPRFRVALIGSDPATADIVLPAAFGVAACVASVSWTADGWQVRPVDAGAWIQLEAVGRTPRLLHGAATLHVGDALRLGSDAGPRLLLRAPAAPTTAPLPGTTALTNVQRASAIVRRIGAVARRLSRPAAFAMGLLPVGVGTSFWALRGAVESVHALVPAGAQAAAPGNELVETLGDAPFATAIDAEGLTDAVRQALPAAFRWPPRPSDDAVILELTRAGLGQGLAEVLASDPPEPGRRFAVRPSTTGPTCARGPLALDDRAARALGLTPRATFHLPSGVTAPTAARLDALRTSGDDGPWLREDHGTAGSCWTEPGEDPRDDVQQVAAALATTAGEATSVGVLVGRLTATAPPPAPTGGLRATLAATSGEAEADRVLAEVARVVARAAAGRCLALLQQPDVEPDTAQDLARCAVWQAFAARGLPPPTLDTTPSSR